MICAMLSDGQLYFAVTHANIDAEVFGAFIFGLCNQLDFDYPNWRENCVVTLDGAGYHTSQKIRQAFTALRVPVLFLGPYMYDGSGKSTAEVTGVLACEKIWSALKKGDLNPEDLASGKKSMRNCVTIVGNTLSRISK